MRLWIWLLLLSISPAAVAAAVASYCRGVEWRWNTVRHLGRGNETAITRHCCRVSTQSDLSPCLTQMNKKKATNIRGGAHHLVVVVVVWAQLYPSSFGGGGGIQKIR